MDHVVSEREQTTPIFIFAAHSRLAEAPMKTFKLFSGTRAARERERHLKTSSPQGLIFNDFQNGGSSGEEYEDIIGHV